uniref:Uncharacterized protein n=1 Tax=Rhizophora mucronata TaxID=61149 RepID=A0A2P2NQ54_RHIMU
MEWDVRRRKRSGFEPSNHFPLPHQEQVLDGGYWLSC